MRRFFSLALIAGLVCCAATLAGDKGGGSAITVQPSTLSADELAQLLGVYVWKLNVSLPADVKRVKVSLLQSGADGQHAVSWGTGAGSYISKDTKNEVLVCLAPLDGTSLFDANKIRVSVTAFGTVAGTTADNPLKGLGRGSTPTPEDLGGGTFALVGGFKGNTIASPISKNADVLILMKIEPVAP